jgi:hypothetical protein
VMAFARQLPPNSRPCSFVDTPALIVARLMPARPGLASRCAVRSSS